VEAQRELRIDFGRDFLLAPAIREQASPSQRCKQPEILEYGNLISKPTDRLSEAVAHSELLNRKCQFPHVWLLVLFFSCCIFLISFESFYEMLDSNFLIVVVLFFFLPFNWNMLHWLIKNY
jgi:hypothetical protein